MILYWFYDDWGDDIDYYFYRKWDMGDFRIICDDVRFVSSWGSYRGEFGLLRRKEVYWYGSRWEYYSDDDWLSGYCGSYWEWYRYCDDCEREWWYSWLCERYMDYSYDDIDFLDEDRLYRYFSRRFCYSDFLFYCERVWDYDNYDWLFYWRLRLRDWSYYDW